MQAIQRVITQHFDSLFRSSNPSTHVINEVLNTVTLMVSSEMNDMLLLPFTPDEVKRALHQMYPYKSPGLDAYVPGHLITDNILIPYEINHFLAHKYWGRKGHIALKLDISKAYDRVEWSFLERALHRLGFHETFVSLIMACVSTVSFSFMLNGSNFKYIRPNRGICLTSSYAGWRKGAVVTSLLNDERVGWDAALVRALFPSHDADSNLEVPVKGTDFVDNLIWHYGLREKFTVSSAYRLTLTIDEATHTKHRTGSTSGNSPDWKFIWIAILPPKVQLFAWRMCKQAVPTLENLARRGVKGLGAARGAPLQQKEWNTSCFGAPTQDRFGLSHCCHGPWCPNFRVRLKGGYV
ncbi:UNVERIFIED_CONTAM: hypothetical protein Sradi_0480400 [Sesamum radiatum]|uniref:Reverse transcriptase zinc-binding domain-containing protein n=1 Tax=Sesamum radiatum TaxID=300843 RepID=A0AAW2W7Q8_SESRA